MILTADRVIFGDSKKPPRNVAVYIVENEIAGVGPLEELKSRFPAETVKSYPGATIMPGMIDLHIHLGTDRSPDYHVFSDYMWAFSAVFTMGEALKRGVTTVRDVGSHTNLAIDLRKASRRGYVTVPRIFTCDTGLIMTGGHGTIFTDMECDGEWEIRKAIRDHFKRGADWIKILTSEAYRGQEYTQQELDAAVDECHRMGRPVAVHAGYQPSVKMAIKAGFDTIEHGTCMDLDDANEMIKKGITWVPTMTAFFYMAECRRAGEDPSRGNHYRGKKEDYFYFTEKVYNANFKKLYDTGVKVACGTDMYITGMPACPVPYEMNLMVKLGLTPLQAIETATKNNGEALRMDLKIGQIEEGYLADIIVVEGNPAEDVGALENIREVYLDGKCVKKEGF